MSARCFVLIGWLGMSSLVLCGSGCSTMSSSPMSVLGESWSGRTPNEAVAELPPRGTLIVEVREINKKPKAMEVPLRGDMHVQDIVTLTKADKKYADMDIYVVRATNGNTRHKMDAKYDPAKNVVMPEYDYALYPDDYIILTEKPSTEFEKMISRVTGPLGRMAAIR